MNQIVKSPAGLPVGTQQGGWMWDGTQWVCCPDGCPPCPPFGPPVFSGPAGQPPWYPGANGGVSFGTTPPANPVRGHFWWDGITLWLFDGAGWIGVGGINAGGGTSTGSQPPPNPVPGTQWFDGTTLWIWTGTAWIAIGPGTGGGIGSPNVYSVTRFTTPGSFSFTVPNDAVSTTTWKFHLQAGGGGGGSAGPGGTWSGQGGGGGEYKQIAATGLAAGVVVSCTVGAAGIGGTAGGDGGAGGDSSLFIANTNSTIVAKGGAGGWGDLTATNGAGQGLGGKNGIFTPGTQNIMLVMAIPGADAHFGVDINDAAIAGGNAFLGWGQPAFNGAAGWNDTTLPGANGGGGRGGYNLGDNGGNGTAGIIIIERNRN